MDVFIVLISVVDVLLNFALVQGSQPASVGNASALRVTRVVRIVRVAKVIRVMRFFRELRIMVFSILRSMKSLLWSIIVLCSLFFVFGIYMTTGVTEYYSRKEALK